MKRFSFDHFGCVALEKPLSLALYVDWLEAGHHANMEYLKRHLPQKENPQLLSPRARSAIVVAKNYLPHPYPDSPPLRFSPRTALYGRGKDYHLEFRRELEDLKMVLQSDFASEEFLCFTDSAPVLERDLAARAGLGWVGKNSCLIHPEKGSLFFIGEIYTSLDLSGPEALVPDFCGTCDRCIRACPTQAFEAPRKLNANKCISYWTIEAKEAAPVELREKFGDWFFGCDICQTVCPWNEKVFGKLKMQSESHTPQLQTSRAELIEDLRLILSSSNKTLSKRFAQHAFSRARANGLKRNALYVIGNLKLTELSPEVESYPADGEYAELAQWTRARLNE